VKPPHILGDPGGVSGAPRPRDRALKSPGTGAAGFISLRCGINSPAEADAGAALCAPAGGGGEHRIKKKKNGDPHPKIPHPRDSLLPHKLLRHQLLDVAEDLVSLPEGGAVNEVWQRQAPPPPRCVGAPRYPTLVAPGAGGGIPTRRLEKGVSVAGGSRRGKGVQSGAHHLWPSCPS